jgi:ATP-binding cassette subfamily C protein LapB
MKAEANIDLLLDCLGHIALRYDRNIDSEALLSGLPVDSDLGVTPELFPRVAARAGFKAIFQRAKNVYFDDHAGPVVLLLSDNRVGVIFNSPDQEQECFVLGPDATFTPVERNVLQHQHIGYAFVLLPVQTNEPQKTTADMDIASQRQRWFWLSLWRYRSYYAQMIPASVLVNLFSLSMPFFVMIVYDKVVPNHAVETLWVLAIGVTLVYLFDLMIRLVRGALLERAGRELDFELASMLFEQVLSLSCRSIPNSTGSLANRVKAYETLREFFVSATMLVLADLPFTFLMIGVVFFVAGPIGWLLLIAVIAGIAINVALQIPLYKSVKNDTATGIERQSLIGESISNLESIKAYNAEGYLQRRMNKLLGSSARSGVKSHWYALLGNSTTTSLVNLTSVAVIIAGVYQVHAGALSMGGLIATVMLTGRCMAPLAMVAGLMTRLQQTMQSLESLTDVMQMEREVDQRKAYIANHHFTADYRFDQTVMTYGGQHMPALNIDSLSIGANENVALLGKIGCGKSTLIKLMAGSEQATGGTVLLDGIDASQYHPFNVRARIGYVPQEPALFDGTLRDNIVLGDTTISDAAIMQAAKSVGFRDYINQHPHGLNAEVGERGALLSGGQRKIVALLRCLVRDYSTYLLDEPTANLDPHTEQLVMQALGNAQKNTNVNLVISTHNRRVLELVERVIVLDNGKVQSDGTVDAFLGDKPVSAKSRSKATFRVKNTRSEASA